jgi:hypothetical protein
MKQTTITSWYKTPQRCVELPSSPEPESSSVVPMTECFVAPLPTCILSIVRGYLAQDQSSHGEERAVKYAEERARTFFEVLCFFTREQQRAFDLAIHGKSNLFVHGPGGTGKSYVIHAIRKLGKTKVCSHTGIAAHNIDGVTISSLLIPDNKVRKMLRNLDFLTIDEVSTCSAQQLQHLLHIGVNRIVMFGDFYQLPPVINDMKEPNQLQSDYQIRLSEARAKFTGRNPDNGAKYAFENSYVYNRDTQVVELTVQFRQAPHERRLASALAALRNGKSFDHSLRSLVQDRTDAYIQLSQEERDRILHLYVKNTRVSDHNIRIFDTLPEETEQSFTQDFVWCVGIRRSGHHSASKQDDRINTVWSCVQQEISAFKCTEDGKRYMQYLDSDGSIACENWASVQRLLRKNVVDISSRAYKLLEASYDKGVHFDCVAAGGDAVFDEMNKSIMEKREIEVVNTIKEDTNFREGQRVMVTQNHRQMNVMNGMMGVILRMDNTDVELLLDDGREYTAQKRKRYEDIIIKRTNGTDVLVSYYVNRMPLVGANAITVYKSQGLSLPKVVLCLDEYVPPATGYVGLSRCVSECGLYFIKGVRMTDLTKRDPSCVKFMRKLHSFVHGDCDSLHLLDAKRCSACTTFYHGWHKCKPGRKRPRVSTDS